MRRGTRLQAIVDLMHSTREKGVSTHVSTQRDGAAKDMTALVSACPEGRREIVADTRERGGPKAIIQFPLYSFTKNLGKFEVSSEMVKSWKLHSCSVLGNLS